MSDLDNLRDEFDIKTEYDTSYAHSDIDIEQMLKDRKRGTRKPDPYLKPLIKSEPSQPKAEPEAEEPKQTEVIPEKDIDIDISDLPKTNYRLIGDKNFEEVKTPKAKLSKLLLFISFLTFLFLTALLITVDFNIKIINDNKVFISFYFLGNIIASAVTVFLSIDILKSPVKNLFSQKPTVYTTYLIALFFSICHLAYYFILYVIDYPYELPTFFMFIPALMLVVLRNNKLKTYRKQRLDQRIFGFDGEKVVSFTLQDTNEKKTYYASYTTNKSYKLLDDKKNNEQKIAFYYISMLLLILLSVVTKAIIGTNFVEILTIFATMTCLIMPVSGMFAVDGPILSFTDKLRDSAIGLWSKTAPETLSKADKIIINDSDIFPRSSVRLNGIKVFGSARIDEIIIYIASIYRHLENPLSDVLFDIIGRKKELCKNLTSLKYFDGQGVYAEIDDMGIYIGNERFMYLNRIPIRDKAIVDKVRAGGREPVFVACNHEIAALMSFEYINSHEVRKWLKKLILSGTDVYIRTYDPNITPTFVSEKLGVHKDYIFVIPTEKSEMLVNLMDKENTISTASVAAATGEFKDFARGFVAASKISIVSIIARLIYYISSSIGFAIAAFLMLFSTSFAITPLILLVYQLLWLVPVWISSYLYKLSV